MERILKRGVWLIFAIPAVYLAIIWKKLPGQVAMHFDLKGNPDRIGEKKELILAMLILTVVNILTYLLLTNIYRIDPKKYAVENKARLTKIAFAVAVFLSGISCLLLYSSSKGSIGFSIGLLLSATGLLFAVIGNYLPNLKPNYFAGLRLPWTLENSDNWKKTHQYAGKLWFGGGLLIAVVCLFLPAIPGLVIFFFIILVITIIPCVYSYRMYKQQKSSGTTNANAS